MRVVEVDPEKEPRRLLIEPGYRRIRNLGSAALGLEVDAFVGLPPNAIVIDIEPIGQAEPAIEDVGADERRRSQTGLLKHARQRRRRCLWREDNAVVANAVRGR